MSKHVGYHSYLALYSAITTSPLAMGTWIKNTESKKEEANRNRKESTESEDSILRTDLSSSLQIPCSYLCSLLSLLERSHQINSFNKYDILDEYKGSKDEKICSSPFSECCQLVFLSSLLEPDLVSIISSTGLTFSYAITHIFPSLR